MAQQTGPGVPASETSPVSGHPGSATPIPRTVTAYAGLWSVLVLSYFLIPAFHLAGWLLIGLLALAAVLYGVHSHRPSSTAPWWLVVLALGAFVLGDGTYNVLTDVLGQDNPFPSLADACYLLCYPAFALALLVFHWRISTFRNAAVMIDSLIIGGGLGLLVWIYWIGPYVSADDLGVLEKVISIGYPLGDILLLALLARLLLLVRSHPPALMLLTAGTVSLLAGDVLYGFLQLSGSFSSGALIDLFWFACYGLWGAAALHPSMRSLTVPQPARSADLGWSRLALIGAACFIAPAVLLHRALLDDAVDTGVIAVFSTALFALVLARFAGVVRQQRRSVEREQALRQVSGELAGATTWSSIKAITNDSLPRVASSAMVSRVVLRNEFETASGVLGDVVVAYGSTPRGRVLLLEGTLPTAAAVEGEQLLIVPITSGGGSELLGLASLSGGQAALATVGDAVETLTAQVALALVRVTLNRELVSRRSEEQFGALIQNATDVIVVLDESDRVRYATPSLEGLIGQEPASVMGRLLSELLHPDSRQQAQVAFSRLRRRSQRAQDLDDWRVLARDGRAVEVEVSIADLRDVDLVEGLVLTMRDVTVRRQLERELTHRAFHDPVTGLANRVLFNDRTDQALRRTGRTSLLAAVLFCDLDDFKDVNDLRGHAFGDRLLQQVAGRVAKVIRPADTAARLGGDEFAVLAEDLKSMDEVQSLGERVVACLSQAFVVDGEPISVTGSVGMSTSADGADPTELLRSAELAMYAAKEAGKDTWRLFAPEMQAEVAARIELRADMEVALRDGDFRLVHQPLVDMHTGRAIGVETLVRWQHRRRGLLAPADFLSVAEDTGLIVPLGTWVLRTALQEARQWRLGDGSRPSVHVNVSARQMQSAGFREVVRQALADADFPADTLVLELTESLYLEHDAQVKETMAEVKALGVRLAMDDFGTGYSSLGYLRNFPVDLLKIDKAFVRDLAQPNQRALVDAIVRIALALQLEIVAEGVEDTTQREVLLALGCSTGQGYYYARPVPAADIPELLRRPLPRGGATVRSEPRCSARGLTEAPGTLCYRTGANTTTRGTDRLRRSQTGTNSVAWG